MRPGRLSLRSLQVSKDMPTVAAVMGSTTAAVVEAASAGLASPDQHPAGQRQDFAAYIAEESVQQSICLAGHRIVAYPPLVGTACFASGHSQVGAWMLATETDAVAVLA